MEGSRGKGAGGHGPAGEDGERLRQQPKARRSPPPESVLRERWGQRRYAAVPVGGAGGRRVRVVFPGRPNGGPGPDFRDAVLKTPEGSVFKGDIEVHANADAWYTHGHDRDPAYQDVALHVVWRPSGAAPTTRDVTGRAIPVATLQGTAPSRRPDPRPCTRHPQGPDPALVGQTLDELGDARFRERAAALAAKAETQGPDQALYGALLEALGYASNREAFAALAERMPYAALAEHADAATPGRRRLWTEALLFGAAGLLPSQRMLAPTDSLPWGGQLEATWAKAGFAPLSAPPTWRFGRGRPENWPPRRVAAAAALTERFLPGGPVQFLAACLDPSDPEAAHLPLRRALQLEEDGYWATHWDFGRERKHQPALLGPGRAADMVVNAVLPFFYGWALRAGEPEAAVVCLAAYRAHPRLSDNQVTRVMQALLLPNGARGTVTTARRQQGLIHLFRRRCSALLCGGCALGGG